MRSLFVLFTSALLVGAFASGCSSKEDLEDHGPGGALSIEYFRANPTSVSSGEQTILSWKTHNAVAVHVFAGETEIASEKKNEGSVTFTVTQTTSFRLVAESASGEKKEETAQVEVKKAEGPEITFSADSDTVDYQGSTLLLWETKGAVRVVITPAGGEAIVDTDRPEDAGLLSGEKQISPERATIYELVATDAAGKTAAKALEVVVVPVIESFGATDPEQPVSIGSLVDLSWKTLGAEAVEITTPEGGTYDVPAGDRNTGSARMAAGASGVFVLRATRGKGVSTHQYRATLTELPLVGAFTVAPGVIEEGKATNVTVSWRVSNARTVAITADDGREIVPSSAQLEGSTEFEATAATVLTLVATNPAGTTVREAVVDTVEPVVIHSFTAVPDRVLQGGIVRLSWSTENASALLLDGGGTPIEIGQEAEGFVDVEVGADSTFNLVARNAANGTKERSVSVAIGEPTIDTFEPAANRFLPGEPIVLTWTGHGGRTATVESIQRDGSGAIVAQKPVCTIGFPTPASSGTCTDPAPQGMGRYEYRLMLVDGAGVDALFATALVSDGPAIDLFQASPATVSVNEALTLRWQVQPDAAGNAPELSLTVDGEALDVPALAANPSEGVTAITLADAGIKRLTLSATSNGGTTFADRRTVTVSVLALPRIDSFTADPPRTNPGNPVTLSWATANATRAQIVDANNMFLVYSIPANALAAGSTTVFPPSGSTTYRLVAFNPRNAETSHEIAVSAGAEFDVPPTANAGDTIIVSWSTSGGTVTLTPFMGVAPESVTATAPFEDIAETGTVVALRTCGATYSDERCGTIEFPPEFTFPFDGVARTGVDVYENGFLGFEVGRNPGNSYSRQTLPTAAYPFVHLAPMWSDLSAYEHDGRMQYELRTGPEGDYLIVQWTDMIDVDIFYEWEIFDIIIDNQLTFQVVLWANGAVDFRYGTLFYDEWLFEYEDGEGSSIGYQDTTRATSHSMGTRTSAVPGGLANRSWRYFERTVPAEGSQTFTVHKTTIFTLCVDEGSGRTCEQRTVVVN